MTPNSRNVAVLLAMCFVLAGCTGSTARVQQSDVQVDRRANAITPWRLDTIDVRSEAGSFNDRDERENFASSIRSIVQRANIFGQEASKPYTLAITILDFDIPKASFSGFNSTLDVRYELKDAAGNVVFAQDITSGGTDDSGSFLGPVRQNRSRTVAVANNIETFAQSLASRMEQHARQQQVEVRPQQQASAPVSYQSPPPGVRADLAPVELAGIQLDGSFSFGRYHALIIGNNAYAHITPLESAVADARRLEEILRTRYGFATNLLIDANRDEIVSAVTSYRRTLGPTDNLLIYFAGHGWVDEQADEGYWLPVDAGQDDPTRWISNSTLTTTIRAMQANHVLVIADSCFSGKLTRGVNVGIRGNDYLRQIVSRKARTALTSGGLEPVVDSGGKGGHSVFASALFEALETNNGAIDTSQIFNFVRRQVALNADQFPEYGDIRRAGHDGGDFVFVRSN